MSDKTKWTPGPWEKKNGTDVFTTLGAANSEGIEAAHNDGWHVADCAAGWTSSKDGEEAELSFAERQANARLIAAAPDLYEALEAVMVHFGPIAGDCAGGEQAAEELRVADKALAAMKQARGEQ